MVASTDSRLSGPVVRVADHDAAGIPSEDQIVLLSSPLGDVLTDEFDGALTSLRLDSEALLLSALGRAVERTLGSGAITVDVVDGTFAGKTVVLRCVSARDADATAMLREADRVLTHSSVRGADSAPEAQIALSPAGTARVDLDSHRALQVGVRRLRGVLHLDWCYDGRRFDSYTIDELAEQFPLALIELTSEATGPQHGSDTPVAGWAFAG